MGVDKKVIELHETYPAVDGAGVVHTIRVYTMFIHTTEPGGGTHRIEAMKYHKLQNGNHVEVKPDGTLEEVKTGRKLRRVK